MHIYHSIYLKFATPIKCWIIKFLKKLLPFLTLNIMRFGHFIVKFLITEGTIESFDMFIALYRIYLSRAYPLMIEDKLLFQDHWTVSTFLFLIFILISFVCQTFCRKLSDFIHILLTSNTFLILWVILEFARGAFLKFGFLIFSLCLFLMFLLFLRIIRNQDLTTAFTFRI